MTPEQRAELKHRVDQAVRARLARRVPEPWDNTCDECLHWFERRTHNQRYCSEACKRRASERRWYPRRKELEREYRARSRGPAVELMP